ncbi:hypothetical protein TCE0_013f00793 [Talaromyces pinophilus]|uniref:Uncharacterized protein n=1 Tax=Talaromyces pinophilus TaxID=128442 RepID=A0A698XL88_TALPI|nr:hypothetical protein TCE0_013f00793 [Talaromyces pinophilus]
MAPLADDKLQYVVAAIARRLDEMRIDYAIMGGAAVCLLSPDPTRMTEDVDLVIHVDQRRITADNLTTQLLRSYPREFGSVSQFGHIIPAYKLNGALIELEVFDQQSWPQRPQYNIPNASRWSISLNGYTVKVFSPEWILREKILSQHQRQGLKEQVDIRDAIEMLSLATPGKPELNFDSDPLLGEALVAFIRKRPDQERSLRQKIRCRAVFRN